VPQQIKIIQSPIELQYILGERDANMTVGLIIDVVFVGPDKIVEVSTKKVLDWLKKQGLSAGVEVEALEIRAMDIKNIIHIHPDEYLIIE